MFQPDDEQALRRMLATTGELPPALEAEYDIRRRLCIAAGGSGSVGPAVLVSLVRDLDLELPRRAEVQRLDFDNVPLNARVATLRYGSWVGGVYLGKGESGKICVRLDGERDVLEICNRPNVLRLEHVDYVSNLDDVNAKLVEAAIEGDEARLDALIAERPIAEAATYVPSEDDIPADNLQVVDWGNQAPGLGVWYQDDGGEVHEGLLHHTDENGKVFLLVGEQEIGPLEPEDVFLA